MYHLCKIYKKYLLQLGDLQGIYYIVMMLNLNWIQLGNIRKFVKIGCKMLKEGIFGTLNQQSEVYLKGMSTSEGHSHKPLYLDMEDITAELYHKKRLNYMLNI